MVKQNFSLLSFSYRHFNFLGNALSRLYSSKHAKLEQSLADSGLKIYPPAYYAMIGFLFLLATVIIIPIIVVTGIVFLVPTPFLVPLLGYIIPAIMAKDKAQKLDLEVPFAGTYVSVMATGGLSPYASLKRLKKCDLLPNMSKAIKDIEIDVQIKGIDPISAMEKSAKHLPSKDYKDLMLGYTSTQRTGGDVIHYLLIRTENLFKNLAIKVKAFGERASVLIESYITISILMTLMLTIMFMTSLSLQQFWQGNISASTFLIFGYLIIPIISLLFIYLSDSQQMNPPMNDWRTYKVFFAFLPLTVFLAFVMFVPFAFQELTLPFAQPFMDFVAAFQGVMGLPKGYESAIGLGLALLASCAPAAVANFMYANKGKDVEHNVSIFMRDLTETRKTGASPESCLTTLSGRDYGQFSPILEVASRQIRWGLPFSVIYKTFKEKMHSWLALINIYLLVDAIEVGGGTPETLETLTQFSEEITTLQREKKHALRPLLFMPYIGAAILIFSTIIFLGFSGTILGSFGHQSIPFAQIATIILPPLILQTFFIGLVTGKISSGDTAAGFKHASILVILALIMMPIAGLLTASFKGGL
jgi:flagellar protein FlaJ